MPSADPHDLQRFLTAQALTFEGALAELRTGAKRSHWMWFIFPQMRGLGSSYRAYVYGISSAAEARAYLTHATLGPRLALVTETVLATRGRSLHDIFGSPDDLKFRSSMTLFETAAPPGGVFSRALDQMCHGERDGRTLALLAQST